MGQGSFGWVPVSQMEVPLHSVFVQKYDLPDVGVQWRMDWPD